jgi:hypothetical protein
MENHVVELHILLMMQRFHFDMNIIYLGHQRYLNHYQLFQHQKFVPSLLPSCEYMHIVTSY